MGSGLSLPDHPEPSGHWVAMPSAARYTLAVGDRVNYIVDKYKCINLRSSVPEEKE